MINETMSFAIQALTYYIYLKRVLLFQNIFGVGLEIVFTGALT